MQPRPLQRRPLQRSAAVIAVAGGAFSLVGAAAPVAVAPVALAVDVGPLVRSSIEPVVPEPDLVDATQLVQAVTYAEAQIARADAERAAAEKRAAEEKAAQEKAAAERAASVNCDLNTSGLGTVKSNVRSAAEFLGCQFGEPTMFGVAGRGGTSDHPSGHAVDFMVDRATGDALADCALRNKSDLGITYVIWRQRINYGSGWESMEDRGGATANHMDHVHVSFGSGSGEPTPC